MGAHFPEAAPVRHADEVARLENIDRRVKQLALEREGNELEYPALISRAIVERAEYPRAFPHLLYAASHLRRPEFDGPGLLDPENLAVPEWCLSPAVCYHVYAHLAHSAVDRPLVVTARGRCFRHEAETSPGVRQVEFQMREIVLVGVNEWVEDVADSLRSALEALAREFGLFGKWEVAEDPFFLPKAEGKALMQRLLETKLEYRTQESSPLALASVNRHGTFFGERFGIIAPSGGPAHTACVAVGLDRWLSRAAHGGDRR